VDENTAQLIGIAVITLAQVYAIQPWKYPFLAAILDLIARATAWLSWKLGFVAMHARESYYEVVAYSE
jgi:hypothetical protein